jgi:hypothetical protein
MDANDWHCANCGQAFRSFDVPTLTAECKLVHPDECPPNCWTQLIESGQGPDGQLID